MPDSDRPQLELLPDESSDEAKPSTESDEPGFDGLTESIHYDDLEEDESDIGPALSLPDPDEELSEESIVSGEELAVADGKAAAEAIEHGEAVLEPLHEEEPEGLVLPELPWLNAAPPLDRVKTEPRLSRLVGAALGGAIGDAVGHPTEFISSFRGIRARYGERGVLGYELYWNRGGRRFAPYTDDTQMAEVVFRSLLESQRKHLGLDATMKTMAAGFVHWSSYPQGGHRAPGNACMAGCRALARGVPWSEAGGPTAGGCGSVMRAYPFGLFFSEDLGKAERWAVAHSKLTHRDPIALAACAAMAVGTGRILRGETLSRVLSEMVGAACRYSAKTAEMMALAIHEAETGVDPEHTLQRLQAWAAHEAIAAAVYILARHPDDPRAAILEGANTPGDSDSIATLAGALVGARTGVSALPTRWVAEVERSDVFVQLACNIAA
ncbi:MAG: ADP-ribosylglycohydrolase family protein [Myxococcota bacterium]